ncbi:MAG: hypothetical protein AAF555_06145 [Verrucomicrobiota bacterium]
MEARFLEPDRAFFRFTGPDAIRYLNGQVTANVAKLVEGEALPALVPNPKGMILGLVWLHRVEDAIWVDAPGSQREELGMRLERYLIADDAEMEDRSDEFGLVHQVGSGEGVVAWRWGLAGRDQRVSLADWPQEAGDDPEALRVAQGIPLWGQELSESVLPAEVGLDEYGVDFHKGCYLGQEVISRMKLSGKVRQRLCHFQLEGEAAEGQELFREGREQAVGRLTSIAGQEALGFVKSALVEEGASFEIEKGLSSSAILRQACRPRLRAEIPTP